MLLLPRIQDTFNALTLDYISIERFQTKVRVLISGQAQIITLKSTESLNRRNDCVPAVPSEIQRTD